jgi:hypothetical protein
MVLPDLWEPSPPPSFMRGTTPNKGLELTASTPALHRGSLSPRGGLFATLADSRLFINVHVRSPLPPLPDAPGQSAVR